MNVILIGLRGSGKTTIAQKLARQLNRQAIDMDEQVCQSLNAPNVTDAWNTHGQATWRKTECDILDQLLNQPNQIIAAGGGLIVSSQARKALLNARTQKTAQVIFLDASLETLQSRLAGNTADRPTLSGTDPISEIEQISAARRPFYLECADHTIDVSALTPQQTVDHIIAQLA